MRLFEIHGTFEAEDIDDALWWIAEYDPTDEDSHPANGRLYAIEIQPLAAGHDVP